MIRGNRTINQITIDLFNIICITCIHQHKQNMKKLIQGILFILLILSSVYAYDASIFDGIKNKITQTEVHQISENNQLDKELSLAYKYLKIDGPKEGAYPSIGKKVRLKNNIEAKMLLGTFNGLPGIVYPIQGQGDIRYIRKNSTIRVIKKKSNWNLIKFLKDKEQEKSITFIEVILRDGHEYNSNWIMSTTDNIE